MAPGSSTPSPSPDDIVKNWTGMIDNDFEKTIRATFKLPENDRYVYSAEGFAMTLSQIEELISLPQYKYIYRSNGEPVEIPPTDITAYTTLFTSTLDPAKSLKSFSANAKKSSPRETVAHYLLSQRLFASPSSSPSSPVPVTKPPKLKTPHPNPYYDIWVWTCHIIGFLGPLNIPAYTSPTSAKQTHPILPVLYHHFGCLCPSFEALHLISQLVARKTPQCTGVLELASGNGYWTYMLRRMGVLVTAVDNLSSSWRYTWIPDTIRANGVDYLKKNNGGKDKVLLLVYMVTAGEFTRQVLKAYKGDVIVLAGTQNANRFTGFAGETTEEYFEREMEEWRLGVRIALPSFAGKDEALYVYFRVGKG